MNNKQSGGKILGYGSFGCVLQPNIKCKKTDKAKYISKIRIVEINNYDDLENIEDEINISNKIKKIEPKLKYFAPIISYCKVIDSKKLNRADIQFINTEITNFNIKNKKKNKCIINLHFSYIVINLILANAGIDLTNILNNSKYTNEKKILKEHLNKSITHLLEGISYLHFNNITHKDIKPDNICIQIVNNKPLLKFIDFGLSEDLSEYEKKYKNIIYSGTPCYMSPDYLVLLELITGNLIHNINQLSTRNLSEIVNNCYSSLKENMSSFTKKGLNKKFLNVIQSNEDSFERLTFNSSIIKTKNINQHNLINKKDIYDLLMYIINLYKKKKLLDTYFEPVNGINAKLDIYSLGLIFFEMVINLKSDNLLLIKLIKNMLELNSINRYSIKDCLNQNIN